MVIDPERQTAVAEQERLIAALTATPEGIEGIAKRAGVPLAKAYRHMNRIIESGKGHMTGKGVKGDPRLYSVVPVDALSSGPPSLGAEEKEDIVQTVLV